MLDMHNALQSDANRKPRSEVNRRAGNAKGNSLAVTEDVLMFNYWFVFGDPRSTPRSNQIAAEALDRVSDVSWLFHHADLEYSE